MMHDMYDLQCLNAGITPGCYRRRGLLAPRCSVIASDAGDSSLLGARSSPTTPGTPRSLVLGHRQRRWALLAPRCSVIASDTGDSLLLGARSSPATPWTPRSLVLGHHQRRRGLLAPRCSVIASDAEDSLAARILLRLVGVLSSCSMLFGSGC